ncbi:hypothetical protein [Streptomyces sp. NPDC058157]|uniref:hypothetical protein n=1 Tax=Streptomyces sp. NPDC058157 TaxID=3346360 RepID=UPI0036EFD0D1
MRRAWGAVVLVLAGAGLLSGCSAAGGGGWSAVVSPVAPGAVSFPLFSPPATWKVDRPDHVRRLTPGRWYSLGFHAPGFADYSGFVHFRAADLAGLEPGEVWADGRAMSPKKFRELVADKC